MSHEAVLASLEAVFNYTVNTCFEIAEISNLIFFFTSYSNRRYSTRNQWPVIFVLKSQVCRAIVLQDPYVYSSISLYSGAFYSPLLKRKLVKQ